MGHHVREHRGITDYQRLSTKHKETDVSWLQGRSQKLPGVLQPETGVQT